MNLKTITTNGGARFTVDADSSDKFLGLLNDLEAGGYPIKGDQSGGYNDRNIAGTNTKSQHAFGHAVDVNWTDNPRGKAGMIPADTARNLAAKYGMRWGGDWSNPDPMHFEVARGGAPAPVADRGMTAVAGVPPPSPQGGVPVPQATAAAALPASDPQSIAAQIFSSLSGNAQAPASDPQQGPVASALSSLTPSETPQAPKQDQQASALQPIPLPELPQSMRRPVDLSRLKEVLASRARLGTA